MDVFRVSVLKHVTHKKSNLDEDSVHFWNSISTSRVMVAAVSSIAQTTVCWKMPISSPFHRMFGVGSYQ